MITTTWQILWMPCADDGHCVARDEDPQAADTTRASRKSEAAATRLS
jgi:hypothetical protein